MQIITLSNFSETMKLKTCIRQAINDYIDSPVEFDEKIYSLLFDILNLVELEVKLRNPYFEEDLEMISNKIKRYEMLKDFDNLVNYRDDDLEVFFEKLIDFRKTNYNQYDVKNGLCEITPSFDEPSRFYSVQLSISVSDIILKYTKYVPVTEES